MVNSQAVGGAGCASRACAGCGGRISDRFLLFSMERYWHTRCLKCSCCQAQLGDIGTTCYSKGGMILCRSDYIRLFGHTGACSACGQSIPPSEMVMRAQGNVYHLKVSAAAHLLASRQKKTFATFNLFSVRSVRERRSKVFLLCDVQKPSGPRRPFPLRQRHHLLRARPAQCHPAQCASAGEPCAA
ncbi:LIM domain transcription factor LMO4.1 isoform X2 [Ictalurus furcatus]|uniref:LIM domain transcription factor LMO4.1 isoform X2 n=1 Tax=Ictalurus furcatus TaxID=66913 RepID=UPI002350E9AE|nr:LIM domain transcription factor LMO4.1 isoform X2 [Ictalurus furcatus]